MKTKLLPILFFLSIIVNAQNITTVAGNGTWSFSGDGGPATSAGLNQLWGVALDVSGNIYIAGIASNRIRKVNIATGIITTVAGTGTAGYNGDGIAATSAQLNGPEGIALDIFGNIYIADSQNNRIRKGNVSTGIITTVAGTGTAGYNGDGILAITAQLNGPDGIILDALGNIYISDDLNSRVRKVDVSTGIITTVAGGGTNYPGNGGLATSAQLWTPDVVALDALGNIYLGDDGNGTSRIFKVTVSTGIITTVAGGGTHNPGDAMPADSATLFQPTGLAVDTFGNIYIAEQNQERVRKVTASTGIISTIAGTGIAGFGGDGGLADSAQLHDPTGIAVTSSGCIYISDRDNARIRAIASCIDLGIESLSLETSINIYPNPTSGQFQIQMDNGKLSNENYQLSIYNVLGKCINQQIIKSPNQQIDLTSQPSGVYFLQLKTEQGIATKKIVISK